jgi:hypothetical protein
MDINTDFDTQMVIASGTAMPMELATATIESGGTETPVVGILFIFMPYAFDFVIDRMPA